MPDPARPLKPQLQRLVLGGPLASLVLAALCLGVFALALVNIRSGATTEVKLRWLQLKSASQSLLKV